MKYICSFVLLLFASVIIAQEKEYTNPVLAGFYPDPSICKAGEDYYMVNSSFAYYPGLPLFHSKDLVSWRQIGHAMNRPSQLNLDGAGVSRGLFAPAISFHKGVFYIVCTLIDKGGNFVITAKDPAGPWSDPVWLKEVDGIDPSLFFDGNDSAWIIYNSVAPDNKPLYDGHRTIRMRAFDQKALKTVGAESIVVNGGTDLSKKPVWIEGPHLYHINNWYYLLCAEGGTGYNHSEVVFRSKSPGGPFTPYSGNPILTQRQLDPSRANPITTTGHADLVQTASGEWNAVFLGCRPYEGEHFNIGRETFLAPVRWKDDWPIITTGNELVRYSYPLPYPAQKPAQSFGGNFTYRNDFNGDSLDQRFTFLRTVHVPWHDLIKGQLALQLRTASVSGRENPSFVGFRQQHHKATMSTRLQFVPASTGEKAGMVLFQNEQHYYWLCKTLNPEGKPIIALYKSDGDSLHILASKPLLNITAAVTLKVVADGAKYHFYFDEGKGLKSLMEGVDARFLSTATAGGFVGTVIGLYAHTSVANGSNTAFYDWFDYSGDDGALKAKN